MPILARDWYGDSENAAILNDDTFALNPRHRTVILFPNSAARLIALPDARKFADLGWGTGRRVFVVANSGDFTVTVLDFEGATQGVVPARKTSPIRWHWAYLHLVSAATAAGDWRFQLKTPP